MKTKTKAAPDNVLDFALEAFSAPSEEEIYQTVQDASAQRMGSVLDQYRTWASTGIVRAPTLEAGELRPYFVTSSGRAAWTRGGLDNRDGFKDHPALWVAVDSIKHRLLYCHSLAIDDAFGWLLYRNSCEKTDDARERLLNYVEFLLHMGPLLRHKILCPVTSDLYINHNEGSRESGWTIIRDHVTNELRADDVWKRLSLDEILNEAPQDVRRKWKKDLREPVAEDGVREAAFLTSCERIGRALSASANAPERLTTYLPFRYDINLLSAFQRSVSERERSELLRLNLPDSDNWLLSRLIDVELPGIGDLDPKELVQIRMGSSEFADWRKTLGDAVKYADATIPANIWDRNEAVRREVSNRLQEGKARLEESLPKAKVKKGVKVGTVAMLGGAIATGLSVLLDPTMTTAAILTKLAATAASSTFAAAAAATEGKVSASRRAARAHYVALLR